MIEIHCRGLNLRSSCKCCCPSCCIRSWNTVLGKTSPYRFQSSSRCVKSCCICSLLEMKTGTSMTRLAEERMKGMKNSKSFPLQQLRKSLCALTNYRKSADFLQHERPVMHCL